MRRNRSTPPQNHERWLVSYADFITLLFAFFVVMFASNQNDKARARAVSEAVKKAFVHDSLPAQIAAALGRSSTKLPASPPPARPQTVVPPRPPQVASPPAPAETNSLQTPLRALNENLQGEIAARQVQLHLEARGLVIGLETAAFFPSGGDAVGTAAYPTLAKVAAVLNQVPNALRLEGHTDSIPINTGRFQSNWELSAARSIAMLRVLQQRFGVSSQRMAVVGYADNAALESNQTVAGRERNRRVDIVIVSDLGMRVEPSPSAAMQPGREVPETASSQSRKDGNKN